jgi:hypothetical protein
VCILFVFPTEMLQNFNYDVNENIHVKNKRNMYVENFSKIIKFKSTLKNLCVCVYTYVQTY